MAIHHAAHAYGNLESLNEEVGEDALLSSIAALNAETEEKARAIDKKEKAAAPAENKRKGKRK